MLSQEQLAHAVADLAKKGGSIDEFARWFRAASRGAHNLPDGKLLNEIFAIEAILSEYHFADMPDDVVLKELANAVPPFASPQVSVRMIVSGPYPETSTVTPMGMPPFACVS